MIVKRVVIQQTVGFGGLHQTITYLVYNTLIYRHFCYLT